MYVDVASTADLAQAALLYWCNKITPQAEMETLLRRLKTESRLRSDTTSYQVPHDLFTPQ